MRRTGLLLGFVIVGAFVFPSAGSTQDVSETASAPVLTVTVSPPSLDVWPTVVAASGRLVAREEITIAAEVGGYRVKDILVEAGSPVHRGDLLAQLETADIENEIARFEATLLSADAALDLAVANLERGRRLSSSGTITEREQLEYDVAERRARADKQAAEVSLKASRLDLTRTKIVAPDDGTISTRSVDKGVVVTAGQEMFRLIQANLIDWRAEVPAASLKQVREGTEAAVFLPSGTISGRVRLIEPVASNSSARVLLHVGMDLAEAAPDLKMGLWANGQLLPDRREALHVPAEAVLMRDGFSYLYLLAERNAVERRRVETGRRIGERVEILSGLKAGERVVQAGGAFLSDGAAVRVVGTAP